MGTYKIELVEGDNSLNQLPVYSRIGISESRLKELEKLATASYNDKSTGIAESFINLSDQAKSIAEVMYLGYMFGQIVGMSNREEIINGLLTKLSIG